MELSIWSQSKIRNKAHLCKLQWLETWELREWKKNGQKQNLGLASGHFCPDHDSWVLHQPLVNFSASTFKHYHVPRTTVSNTTKTINIELMIQFLFFFLFPLSHLIILAKWCKNFFLGWAAWVPLFKEKKGKDKSLYI